MMFKVKSKDTVVSKVEKKPFVIPQIKEEIGGLRTFKPQFTKTEALSPMEGPYTKDVTITPETTTHTDIDVANDLFRVERKFTKEDEISRYGRAYHEFQSVDQMIDTKNYEKKNSQTSTNNAPSVGLDFGGLVQEEIISTENKTEIPVINFGNEGTSIIEEEVIVNEINPHNEVKEEFTAKPINIIPDFLNFNSAPINNTNSVASDDDYPKTIV